MSNFYREDISDVLVVDKVNAKYLKNILESHGLFNSKFRITEFSHTKVAVPVVLEKFSELIKTSTMPDLDINFLDCQMMMPFSKTHLIKLSSVKKLLEDSIVDLFYAKTKRSLTAEALKDLPKEWQIHGNLLLLPKDCMTNNAWKYIMPEIWNIFCQVLTVSRIAKCEKIHDDKYRSSKVELIMGEDGWITRKENGIQYQYDITKCMFSDGNITEKMRIANFDCSGMTVVDLFAGIGYFVLPYLVHAGAHQVYACEWNPYAVGALKRNLELNKVSERCTVLEGDNKLVAPKCVADHVNLGLIPSSEDSWPVACHALNPSKGGWLHIHANVNETEITLPIDECMERSDLQKSSKVTKMQKWTIWANEKVAIIKQMLEDCHDVGKWICRVDHTEHVKSYAPHIDHIVVDMECRPVEHGTKDTV